MKQSVILCVSIISLLTCFACSKAPADNSSKSEPSNTEVAAPAEKADEVPAAKADEAPNQNALSKEDKIKEIYKNLKGVTIDDRCLTEGPIYLSEAAEYRKNKRCLNVLNQVEGYCLLNKSTYLALECDLGDRIWDKTSYKDGYSIPANQQVPFFKVTKDQNLEQAIEAKTNKHCRASEVKTAANKATAQFFLCKQYSSKDDFNANYQFALNN